MAPPLTVEWSKHALRDLDRIALHLQRNLPTLAGQVAAALVEKSRLLSAHPLIGRPLRGRMEFREVIVRALNGPYLLQYRVEAERVVILRVVHGRGAR